MMDSDWKEKWLAALRSGDYKQGKEKLHWVESDTYCCLGVLCDLLEKEGLLTSEDIKRSGEDVTLYSLDDSTPMTDNSQKSWNVVPWVLGEQIGLKRTEQNDLTTLNDTRNYTFEDIADHIEENL